MQGDVERYREIDEASPCTLHVLSASACELPAPGESILVEHAPKGGDVGGAAGVGADGGVGGATNCGSESQCAHGELGEPERHCPLEEQ